MSSDRIENVHGWDCRLIRHDYRKDMELPIEPASADLVFADPPYNQGIVYADDETKDKVTQHEYEELALDTITTLIAAARPGATLWWVCPERHADWMGQMLTACVGERLFRIVWEEAFSQYQQHKLTDDYRFIFVHRFDVLGKGGVTFNPDAIRVPSVRQLTGNKRADPRGRVPGRVWKFPRLVGSARGRVEWHPTQLPPKLLLRIVRGWSNPGDLVLDAFAGSGSLGRACRSEGRRFVGVDKSPTYIQKMSDTLGLETSGARNANDE